MAAGLKAKGVTFTAEPHNIRPGIRICFIRGPQAHLDRTAGARREVQVRVC